MAIDSGPRSRWAVVLDSDESAQVLHVFGDVNPSNATELYSELMQASVPGKTIVLDLSECRYVDPMICTTLLRAHEALGSSFRVIAAQSKR